MFEEPAATEDKLKARGEYCVEHLMKADTQDNTANKDSLFSNRGYRFKVYLTPEQQSRAVAFITILSAV